jgi:hypothetical protein
LRQRRETPGGGREPPEVADQKSGDDPRKRTSDRPIFSVNETFELERASEAYDRMMSGKARFRVVLTIAP